MNIWIFYKKKSKKNQIINLKKLKIKLSKMKIDMKK